MLCDRCNGESITKLRPDTLHYAQILCEDCGKHLKWISNPDKPKTRRAGNKKNIILKICAYHGIEEPICFFCLRKKEQLGLNETLEHDHIKEIQILGKDKVNNMQVLCTACHKLKNWLRLYHNWHIHGKEGENEGTNKKI